MTDVESSNFDMSINQVRDEMGRYAQNLNKTKWNTKKGRFVARETKPPRALKSRRVAYLSVLDVALILKFTPDGEKLGKLADLIPKMSPANRKIAARILLAVLEAKHSNLQQ